MMSASHFIIDIFGLHIKSITPEVAEVFLNSFILNPRG